MPMMIANGTPVTKTEVCRALRPPPASKAIATTPREVAHITLASIGGSSSCLLFLEAESIEVTNAPESEEVTKNVSMMTIEAAIRILANGNCSKNTNKEIDIS